MAAPSARSRKASALVAVLAVGGVLVSVVNVVDVVVVGHRVMTAGGAVSVLGDAVLGDTFVLVVVVTVGARRRTARRPHSMSELPTQRVYPGHNWFVVLEGQVLLWLGARRIRVAAGEAAEFSTMTAHAVSAIDATYTGDEP